MKIQQLILIISSLLSLFKQRSIETILQTENPLLIVTSGTFNRYLEINDNFFIFIHSPWCKWSQKFETILLQINRHLRLEKQTGYIGAIDNTIENFTEHFKTSINDGLLDSSYTYPSLIYFLNGKKLDTYNSRINFDEVFLWMKR